MRITWSESGDGEWRGMCGRYAITIVYQKDDKDEPWVWGVSTVEGTILAGGYETSLEVAMRQAEEALRQSELAQREPAT